MSFPKEGQIYQEPVDRIKNTLSRVSLDTFYQVTFSFGKSNKWLSGNVATQGSARSNGLDFKQKLSLLCTEAELPGTSFAVSTSIGHHQGIVETFPNLRQYPPLNLTFYVDADHVVIEVFDKWMEYINPISNNIRNLNAYSRFSYPDDYKEVIHITKYERDSFRTPKIGETKSGLYHYEFINVWPTNMTSMKVNYGQSDVLKCSVQLSYDRYFTSTTPSEFQQVVLQQPDWAALDVVNRNASTLRDGTFSVNTTTTNVGPRRPLGQEIGINQRGTIVR